MKYEKTEVDRSAIIQDFRYDEYEYCFTSLSEMIRDEKLSDRRAAILDLISAKFVMGYPCVKPYFLFYIHGPAILHCFELRK